MSTITLKTELADAIKNAMRARDSLRLNTLRLVQAAIKQKEIDSRCELEEIEVQAIFEKQVKQRRESIAAFEQAGRTESAEQEQAELLILQEFLPQPLSSQEVDAAIDAAIADANSLGLVGAPAMGKVMAALKTSLAGRADMSAVSGQVKARLIGAK